MSKRCYLCNRKPSKNEYISLHRFPKNTTFRQKWKNVCGLTEADDVSYVYICSVHFAFENVKISKVIGIPKIILTHGSVPFIKIPTPFQLEVSLTSNIKENATLGNVDACSSTDCISIQHVEHMDDDVESSSNQANPDCFDENYINTPKKRGSSDKANPDCSDENYICTPKKRRFHEPRFISEIRSFDFSTPRRTGRILKLILDKNQKNVKAIKRLQDMNRRQKECITSLQELVKSVGNMRHAAVVI